MDGAKSGLNASMWAPITPFSSRANRMRVGERHECRSRSLPPPLSPLTAAASSKTTSSAVPASSSSTAATGSKSGSLARIQAFHRFEQACQRLRWKFIDLENSYKRALAPHEWSFDLQDAERNFKVDFHEFYVWIEQAVVLLLLVFGIAIHRGGGGGGAGTAEQSRGGVEETRRGGVGWAASHAYHHNVLKALDDEENPLHGTLGTGDVNHALWKAKELRNRWKDAADGRETPPLKMYDLSWIVTQILGGLEGAYMVAGERVELDRAGVAATGGNTDAHQAMEEDSWEWMVEPMDWEA